MAASAPSVDPLDVSCPYCPAGVGAPCWGVRGGEPYHYLRSHAATEQARRDGTIPRVSRFLGIKPKGPAQRGPAPKSKEFGYPK